MCVVDWGIVWDAISAIATAAAAIVALTLPQKMDTAARERTANERATEQKDDITEICKAVEEALSHYFDLRMFFDDPHARPPRVPRAIAAHARMTQGVLAILTARAGLTDGVVTVGVGAMELCNEMKEHAAAVAANPIHAFSRSVLLNNAHPLAKAIWDRATKVVGHHGIAKADVDITRFKEAFADLARFE